MVQQGVAIHMQGSFCEAEKVISKALEFGKRHLPEHHAAMLLASRQLALTVLDQRKYDAARPLLENNYRQAREVYKDNHPWIVSCATDLARNCRGGFEIADTVAYGMEALRMVRNMDNQAGH
jgi:hypothetical protein